MINSTIPTSMTLELIYQEQRYLTKSLSKTHILLRGLRAELVDIERCLQEDQPRPKKRRTKHTRWKTKQAVENCENEQRVLLEALGVCEAKITAVQQRTAYYSAQQSTGLWSPTFPVELTLPANESGLAALPSPQWSPVQTCGFQSQRGESTSIYCDNSLFSQPIYGPPTSTYINPNALLYSPPNYSHFTPSMATQYPEELLSPSAPTFTFVPLQIRSDEPPSPLRKNSTLSPEAPTFKPNTFVLTHRRKESVPISPFTQPQISPFFPPQPQDEDTAKLPDEQPQNRRYSADAVDLIMHRLASKSAGSKKHRRNQLSNMTNSSLESVEEGKKARWGSFVEYADPNGEVSGWLQEM